MRHSPLLDTRVSLFLGSTGGRADQRTPHHSNRVWGVLFCKQISESQAGFLYAERMSSTTWVRADALFDNVYVGQ